MKDLLINKLRDDGMMEDVIGFHHEDNVVYAELDDGRVCALHEFADTQACEDLVWDLMSEI